MDRRDLVPLLVGLACFVAALAVRAGAARGLLMFAAAALIVYGVTGAVRSRR